MCVCVCVCVWSKFTAKTVLIELHTVPLCPKIRSYIIIKLTTLSFTLLVIRWTCIKTCRSNLTWKESHWVPLSYGLVPHLSKKLSKFPNLTWKSTMWISELWCFSRFILYLKKLCVYVWVSIYIYIYIYVRSLIYIYIYIYMVVNIYIYIYIYGR